MAYLAQTPLIVSAGLLTIATGIGAILGLYRNRTCLPGIAGTHLSTGPTIVAARTRRLRHDAIAPAVVGATHAPAATIIAARLRLRGNLTKLPESRFALLCAGTAHILAAARRTGFETGFKHGK